MRGEDNLLKLTGNILLDFWRERGWAARRCPGAKHRAYEGVRVYYRGCVPAAECLYFVTEELAEQALRDGAGADLCLLSLNGADLGCAYLVEVDMDPAALCEQTQDMHIALLRWDRQLTELLLDGATMQELLDCSAPILRNPCMLEDNQFYVVASCGQVRREDAPFFYDSIHTGRAPTHLFEELLALDPQARATFAPSNSVNIVQRFSRHNEMLANCMVDGVTMLRFCMVCTETDGSGLRDLVLHLMDRLKSSPGVRSRTAWSNGAVDSLFSRMIENPSAAEVSASAASLGLQQCELFSVVGIYFGVQAAEMASILSKLRVLHPTLHFFMHDEHPFALIGVRRQTRTLQQSLERLQELLFAQLDQLGASYGVSLTFPSLLSLGAACDQALRALDARELLLDFPRRMGSAPPPANPRRADYQDAMLAHMLQTFFTQYSFEEYCPASFRELLADDNAAGGNNLPLLYTYLANQCNATTTARLLHMHRNNVIYRINKLQERYQFDLSNNRQRQLLLALCLAVGYKCEHTV